MNGGELRQELLDRLAGGLRELAASLAGGREADTARIRCVALNMPVANGVARPDLIVHTDYTTLIAHGTVDFGRNRIDLTLSPQAKSLDLNLALPVTISGRLDHPSYGIDETDAARRLASLLGTA